MLDLTTAAARAMADLLGGDHPAGVTADGEAQVLTQHVESVMGPRVTP